MKQAKIIKNKLGLFLASSSLLFFSMLALGVGTVSASPNTCHWTGAGDGETWSHANNWSNCGGTAPQNGDSLTFDVTPLASFPDGSLLNDISNLQVNSISITGTSSFGYTFHGNAFSLGGGIDNSSGSLQAINMDVTLTAEQTFNTNGLLDIGNGSQTLALGGHDLTINSTAGGSADISSVMTGSGTISMGSSLESNAINSNNPNFSGSIVILAGRLIINASHTNQLGTGAVTIDSGATLQESINTTGTYALANPITLGGSGDGSTGALDVHDFDAGGSTLNFTGAFTLTSDAQVSLESANAHIGGAVSGCGFSISKQSGSTGTLSGNLAGKCAVDPGSSSSSTSSTASAPDTGYGSPNSSIVVPILSMAGTILVLAGAVLRFKLSKS